MEGAIIKKNDNPKKLATQDTQDKDQQNPTQYMTPLYPNKHK